MFWYSMVGGASMRKWNMTRYLSPHTGVPQDFLLSVAVWIHCAANTTSSCVNTITTWSVFTPILSCLVRFKYLGYNSTENSWILWSMIIEHCWVLFGDPGKHGMQNFPVDGKNVLETTRSTSSISNISGRNLPAMERCQVNSRGNGRKP